MSALTTAAAAGPELAVHRGVPSPDELAAVAAVLLLALDGPGGPAGATGPAPAAWPRVEESRAVPFVAWSASPRPAHPTLAPSGRS
ncbi:hypothetical protein SAMN05216223_1282 [Actinacidiphila yanglinensis]|uniref:Acyl-CoA carboxylase epsilon subunit n=1 Tax=Actinacidiphila yanglinensis TaxID=310779 RepID=A0A1H6E9J4_9ACTN|nr:acyl-CoA carboxylase epsilon subunit [Actinacidiphila yanglinensis]SEG93505.1 hypothetical protein SAMN05216223_1282 [Actinacidiphila yanglinensis]